jgi:hypothetical protein
VTSSVRRHLDATHWWIEQNHAVHLLAKGSNVPVANCARCKDNDHSPRTCLCLSNGLPCHGPYAATRSHDLAERWWGRDYPGANLAVRLVRHIVIDLDNHGGTAPERPLAGLDETAQVHSGRDAWRLLCRVNGQAEPETRTIASKTPGSVHLWFKVPGGVEYKPSVGAVRADGSVDGLGWQIDVRTASAPVPPTTTRKGEYTFLDGYREAAPLPGWLAVELARTGHIRQPPPQRASDWQPKRLAGGREYVAAAVRGELEAVASSQGQRNDQLTRSAFRLGQFVGAGLLERDAVHQALTEAAEAAGVPAGERKAQDTIRRCIEAGTRSPRQIPTQSYGARA